MTEGAQAGLRDVTFLQSQALPWEPYPMRGAGASRRRLNAHPVTGAERFVLKLAPGYRADPGFLGADFEFYVVDGAVAVNGLVYPPHVYGMHPAGYAHHTFEAPQGAMLIVITTGGPDRVDRGAPTLSFRRDRLVVRIDVATLPWYPGVDPVLLAPHPVPAPAPLAGRRPPEAGVCTKVIWQDPDTKGHTFIKGDLPRVASTPQPARSHLMDSEYFTIEGDYILAGEGRMLPGSYFCWAANTVHGPSSCEFISYVLSKYHGPMAVNPSTETRPVTLDPEFTPPLPPDLRAFAHPVPVPDPWS